MKKKKYAFALALVIALTALSPAIGHADPDPTQPTSTSGVTGSDPVPTSPDQWPNLISIVLTTLICIP